ncbi:methyltransferase [Candidatus Woesearchaeota archaeon]|nr:methyltransferase [Candidatus Woesearchaeota archaeon]
MKIVCTTLKGLEPVTSEELKQLTKSKPEVISDGRLLLQSKNLKSLENARTISTIYEYVAHFSFKTEQELYDKVKKLKIPVKGSFVVRCCREGTHDFKSKNVEVSVGEIIFEQGHKVDLEKPNTTIYVEVVNDVCILGILYKKDLQKRSYKVRLNPASINACLAAAMVRLAKIKPKQVIVDPFCKDGVILIEAALLGAKKVYGFDESMNNVRNAKVNAQVAKVKIEVSKAEIDWLETKFSQTSVDCIVTNPPFPARHRSKEDVEKITKEFMHQAVYVLKKTGLLVFVTQDSSLLDKYAEIEKFKLIKKLEVVLGDTTFSLNVLKPS